MSATKQLIAAGEKVTEIFEQAIIPCYMDIGENVSRLMLYLLEMILVTDVVKAIHKDMKNSIQRAEGNGCRISPTTL